jgi:hypothetical protein
LRDLITATSSNPRLVVAQQAASVTSTSPRIELPRPTWKTSVPKTNISLVEDVEFLRFCAPDGRDAGADRQVLQPLLGRGDHARGAALVIQVMTPDGALHLADSDLYHCLHVREATGDAAHHPLQQRRSLAAGRDEQIQRGEVARGDVGGSLPPPKPLKTRLIMVISPKCWKVLTFWWDSYILGVR